MTISEAIQQLASAWGCSPKVINSGDCDMFASRIADQGFGEPWWGGELYGEDWSPRARSIEGWMDEWGEAWGHCFIVHEHRYYDSECPEGVDWPDELPFYQRRIKRLAEPVYPVGVPK